MAKSIKLQDNTFWDSSSIVHSHRTLDKILGNITFFRQDWGTSLTFYTSHSGHAIIMASNSNVIILYNVPAGCREMILYGEKDYTVKQDGNDFKKLTITFNSAKVITAIST